MSYSVKGTTITLTRGDTFIATITIKRKASGEIYIPQEGDTVRFALKRNLMNSSKSNYIDKQPLIYKEIPIDTMILKIDPEDTKELLFGTYVYDIQITFSDGSVDTFITNATFRITPEVD